MKIEFPIIALVIFSIQSWFAFDIRAWQIENGVPPCNIDTDLRLQLFLFYGMFYFIGFLAYMAIRNFIKYDCNIKTGI